LAAVLAEKQEMKSKLSHAESRCISLQNEMDSMRDRLSRMDKAKKKYEQQEEEHSKEIDELENMCEVLRRSATLSIKESKWEYSAPLIPQSYWTNIGYTDDGIVEMEKFLLSIKDVTCALRRGELVSGNKVVLLGRDEADDDDDENLALTHYNILLPHWREFTDALHIYPHILHEFVVHNIQLSSPVTDLLIPALKGKISSILTLNNNEFTNPLEGIDFVEQIINGNEGMDQFEWMNNHVTNTEDAICLVDIIIDHPSIDDIRLENLLGEDVNGYDTVKELFTSTKSFSYIDLEGNNMKTRGDTAISDFIAGNPPLQYLIMGNNKLNDDDAILIASALKCNTNLQSLHLTRNDITDAGGKTLFNAVCDTTSLNSVADSNHTCRIVSSFRYLDDANDPKDDQKVRRSKKIYNLLSVRNEEGSNVRHFNAEFVDDEDDDSLTLKLLPHVLEAVHRHSKRTVNKMPPLSIVYEILRGWKMPELYDSKRGIVSGRG